MKYLIVVALSIGFGYALGNYGPHKMIDTSNKTIKKATKAIDTVNKKIAQ